MPTYEYKCKKCNHLFEKFQNMSEEPVKACPVCGGKVTRLISGGGGLLFKGNGFYITDHRSSEYKAAAEKESGKKSEVTSDASSTGSSSSDTSKSPSPSSATTSKKVATKST